MPNFSESSLSSPATCDVGCLAFSASSISISRKTPWSKLTTDTHSSPRVVVYQKWVLGSDPEPCRQRAVLTGSWSRLLSIRSLACSLSPWWQLKGTEDAIAIYVDKVSASRSQSAAFSALFTQSLSCSSPYVPPVPQDGAQQDRERTMGPGERTSRSGSWVPCHCEGPRLGTSAPGDS